jgi:hypothetical protein
MVGDSVMSTVDPDIGNESRDATGDSVNRNVEVKRKR